jgi:hypothetical protein
MSVCTVEVSWCISSRVLLLYALLCVCFWTVSIVSASETNGTGNDTGNSANMTGMSADSEAKLSGFVKKLGAVIRQSNINLTRPENVNATEAIQKLQSSSGFVALSEKFAQLAQQAGINASDIQLKNLQGQEGTGNATGLADRLQKLEERIQNKTQ